MSSPRFTASDANLSLGLETSSLCTILSRPRMFSASETYCWISSPFLVLSEPWPAGSTQLFWLRLLSMLTDSIWLLSASSELLCLASNYLWQFVLISWLPILSFIMSSLATCLCKTVPNKNCLCWPTYNFINSQRNSILLDCLNRTPLWTTPNWLNYKALNIMGLAASPPVLVLSHLSSLCSCRVNRENPIADSFCQIFLWFITLSATQLDVTFKHDYFF